MTGPDSRIGSAWVPDRDVDLAIDVAEDTKLSLLGVIGMQKWTSEILDHRVDLGTRASLIPSALAEFA